MFKDGSFLQKHYQTLGLFGNGTILLSILGLFFFLTGVYQGYMDSTLNRLLEVLIGLSTFSTLVYFYRGMLGIWAIFRKDRRDTVDLWEHLKGIGLFLFVLGMSLGSVLFRQWLSFAGN